MQRWAYAALMFLASASAAGCGTSSATVRPNEARDPSLTYIYGRFHIDAESVALGLAGHQSIRFQIRCGNEKVYTVAFSTTDALQVIKLVPAMCQLDYILYTDADGIVRGREMAHFRLIKNEILQPGGVYYVGDFAAVGASSTKVGFFSTKIRWGWAVSDPIDNYQATTQEMKSRFPQLAGGRTENRCAAKAKVPPPGSS